MRTLPIPTTTDDIMFEIVDLPRVAEFRAHLAQILIDEWSHLFPDDTVEWCLEVWGQVDASGDAAPHCVVAMDDGALLGSASVVPDDGLTDAPEPGPWLALTWVDPAHRRRGIGAAMVRELMARCPEGLWLYTESGENWYARMGWTTVRRDSINGHPVTVMKVPANR